MRFIATGRSARRLCATLAALSVAVLAGCVVAPPPKPVTPPPPPPPAEAQAPHQLSADKPSFLRLPNMDKNTTPVRVGIILPFSNASASTRALASAMLKSAELALYDSGNRDILLMTADEATPAEAAGAARKLLSQGAEILVGPLFAASVSAVAPIARDRGVPVLAFSTDRSVAGKGVYLLSFQPQDEVKRVISYAASTGKKDFAALIPRTTYGDITEKAFRDAVKEGGGTVKDVERFNPSSSTLDAQTDAVAKASPDAIFIPQGGSALRNIAPLLVYKGADSSKVKLLGTGLWDDLTITREASLKDGWFAAPAPDADETMMSKYHRTFGGAAPPLATLAYDAISLVALLAPGTPYHRFTTAALTDPNGFAGVDGIFRFNTDGSLDRGLAVLRVGAGGFHVIDPAPTTFEGHGS